MPDLDIVHKNLPYRYQKAYRQICEGHWENGRLAREVSQPLRKDIKHYGNGPIVLSKQAATQLSQIPKEPLLRIGTRWDEESNNIEELRRGIYGNKRGMNLAKKACKEVLREIQNGFYPENMENDILSKYIWNIFDANFKEIIPLADEQFLDLEVEEILYRIENIEPHLERVIEGFAQKLSQKGNPKKLRLPRRSKRKELIDLNENLLTK